MVYQKKYPLAGSATDFLLLEWERGFRNLEIHYHDRLVVSVKNPSDIKKGFVCFDSELNEVQLSFSEKPMSVNVVVNGLHSPVNAAHPNKQFKTIGSLFWAIFSINLLIFIVFILSVMDYIGEVIPYVVASVLNLSVYVIAAVFASKNKIWAYAMGTIYFGLSGLIAFYGVLSGFGIFEIFSLTYHGIMIYFLLSYLKVAKSFIKHNKLKLVSSNDLLDN